jgi:hypothetical protein
VCLEGIDIVGTSEEVHWYLTIMRVRVKRADV